MDIPTEEQTGKPAITTAMKAECLGEFNFTREVACPECCDDGGQCDTCDGAGGCVETITVPWTTCKEIYQAMAIAALK